MKLRRLRTLACLQLTLLTATAVGQSPVVNYAPSENHANDRSRDVASDFMLSSGSIDRAQRVENPWAPTSSPRLLPAVPATPATGAPVEASQPTIPLLDTMLQRLQSKGPDTSGSPATEAPLSTTNPNRPIADAAVAQPVASATQPNQPGHASRSAVVEADPRGESNRSPSMLNLTSWLRSESTSVPVIEPNTEAAFVDESSLPEGVSAPTGPRILFRPAVAGVDQYGRATLRPNVRVADARGNFINQTEQVPTDAEALQEVEPDVEVPEQWTAPFVEGEFGSYPPAGAPVAPRLGPGHELVLTMMARLNGPCNQAGLGGERVMNAISFVETSQPLTNFRIRLDAARDYQSPDRSEYFWAKINGGGPSGLGGETSVDYQDIRMMLEVGSDKFSVATDLPIRILEPTVYANTSGFADMNVTTKTVFLDGDEWQLANTFRIYIPTGNKGKGLGTGHASLEPGFAWRYKWSRVTYIHGDLKFWIPLGADDAHAGEVLSYGVAMSHVWRETDSWAIMPTIEFVGHSFLDGQKTLPGPLGLTEFVDPEGIFSIHPGVRYVWDKGSDCGIQEFGIFSGIGVSSDTLYENLLRAELRWSW